MSWVTEHVLGDRVRVLGLGDGVPVRADHAGIDHVQRAQVVDRVGPADRVVVPGALSDERTGCPARRATEGGDPLGDLVHHPAHRLDLRVEHGVQAMKFGPTTFQCTCLRVSARSFRELSRS